MVSDSVSTVYVFNTFLFYVEIVLLTFFLY